MCMDMLSLDLCPGNCIKKEELFICYPDELPVTCYFLEIYRHCFPSSFFAAALNHMVMNHDQLTLQLLMVFSQMVFVEMWSWH